MDDLLNREYNGWENRFTWLVHLHLSDEQVLSLEIAQVVAGEPNDGPAGRLVEMWVKSSISNWVNRFPGRNEYHDHSMYLLVWNLLGSALSSTEWDALVALLTGGEVVCNVFTMTLSQCIQRSQFLHAHMSRVLRDTPNVYAVADAMKEGFEALLADWIDRMVVRRQISALMSQVFGELLQNIYGLIVWEHVARAFRPEY
jgi:hypothetical protein